MSEDPSRGDAAGPDGGSAASDHERFTGWLRARSEPAWTEATGHRFTEELAADTIDDAVFRRYPVADYRFVEWLRDELDAVGPTLAPARQRRVTRLFERTVDLEVQFFDAAYEA